MKLLCNVKKTCDIQLYIVSIVIYLITNHTIKTYLKLFVYAWPAKWSAPEKAKQKTKKKPFKITDLNELSVE